MAKYSVYALLKDKKPIYIGCTKNLKERIAAHKKNKKFDTCKVIKTYTNKEQAFSAENAILRYETLFGLSDLINKKDESLCAYYELKIKE